MYVGENVDLGHSYLGVYFKMDQYQYLSDSSGSENGNFEGFHQSDIDRASRVHETVSRANISNIISGDRRSDDDSSHDSNSSGDDGSSSSGDDDSSSEDNSSSNESEPDNNQNQFTDLRANPPDWTTNFVPIHVPGFRLPSGPNLPNDWDIRSTPLKYFELFFTPELIDQFVKYSNEYAQIAIRKKRETVASYTDKQWPLDGSKNVTTEELRAYLGCCLILSVNPAQQLKHAFSSDPYMCNHGLRSIFTLKRFTKIGQYLCIYDKENELPRNSPHYDRRFKFKSLVDHLNTVFPMYYKFSEFQAIDESLVKTKCHLPNIIYCPDKPARRGLKIWCRCDSKNSRSCYLFKFEPYMGKRHTEVSRNGLYHDVIFRLCSDLKGSNVKLYFDNLYCSLSVLQDLQKDNIWATGTIRGNRIGLHPTVKKTPKMVRGEHKMFQDKKNPNLTCCVWQDTKQVRYASVACDPSIVGVAVRRISRTYVRVNQPLVAQRYNQHYKSIDLLDQYLAAYPISRRTYRSWKHIYWFCFQTAVVNAYILFKETHPGPLPRTYAHIDFRIALAKELIGNFSNRQVNPISKPLFVGPGVPNEQFVNHQNTKLQPSRIRVCKPHKQYHGVTKRTVYGCQSCEISICKQCHVRWHTANVE